MKRAFLAAIMICMTLILAGCGSGGGDGPVFVPATAQILSDPALDGDIELDSLGIFRVVQGMSPTVQSVFAGIDLVTGSEFRAFLDFPLTGAVPGAAIIQTATLDIFLNSVQTLTPANSIPIRIDLVDFQPPILLETDFSTAFLPALATVTIPIFQSDVGQHVFVDVTPLMLEAQRLGLLNFQVRILLGLGVLSPARIEINDTTGLDRGALAPLLDVVFF